MKVVERVDLVKRYETSPFWNLIGLKVDSITEDGATIKMEVTPALLNGNKMMHGGVFSTLLDAAMGINLKLAVGDVKYVTISLLTHYLKAVRSGETVYATAKIIQTGRSIGTVEASIFNDKDELVSCGSATFKFRRPE
ncbi:PaaI family thioesterase [Planococcus salinus]|uniref:PaaI family thioesterase n=1 Tax=Planococcus salinus TaxID=1848460 RepID=A0A3M8P8N9_9BACL|nr:PaaI family thioesterase [Planococcus salinus]RNF39791.1 PaaI family thioesterase [Planococcus salinus]